MRRSIIALGVLSLTAGLASADPTDLANGVLIAHHPPGIQYSQGQDWCQRYDEEFAISSCQEQYNRIDLDGNAGESSVWYVLAAWTEAKDWCGTEFGFGQYDADIYGFLEWGPCSPAGDLEIPTTSWPGPGEGTAIVATGISWHGNFLAVYYFAGYAYYEGVIPLGADPATGFGGTGNCGDPPESWEAASFGGMGLFTDGIYVCPSGGFGPEGQEAAACCVGEHCVVVTAEECERMGGDHNPGWESCDPNPCIGGFGPEGGESAVCCLDDDCMITTEAWCLDHEGEFYPEWDTCDPSPCNLVCPYGDARWANIQDAIDAAESGWVIELCDATFTGERNRNIDFGGKSRMTLRSRSGNPDDCVIDCQGVDETHGFIFDQDDTGGPTVQGVKVRDCPGGDSEYG